MKPFYQGKIDTFCAIYAVLNALRITHGIRTLKARDLFNDILMALATNTDALVAVLNQTTDYVNLVDFMLYKFAKQFPLVVESPFRSTTTTPTVLEFWDVCEKWINADKQRTAVFRFKRFFEPYIDPLVRHWTAIGSINDTTLSLYDSSHDAEAIQHLHKDSFVTVKEEVGKSKTILVIPNTLRLLRLPF